MADPSEQRLLYGIPVTVPASWEDHSVYRFGLPESPDGKLRATMHAGGRSASSFRANVVASRVPRPQTESVFEEANRQAAQNPSHKLLAGGRAVIDGRQAEWQDLTFFVPELQLQVFQRQVAVMLSEEKMLAVTLTTDQSELDDAFAPLGLPLNS